ncbi:hypothetical protein ACWKTZ_26035 [Bacillus cereus]
MSKPFWKSNYFWVLIDVLMISISLYLLAPAIRSITYIFHNFSSSEFQNYNPSPKELWGVFAVILGCSLHIIGSIFFKNKQINIPK